MSDHCISTSRDVNPKIGGQQTIFFIVYFFIIITFFEKIRLAASCELSVLYIIAD